MSEVVHNLPPENGADKDPKKWQNSYDKDPRGIDKVWKTADRVEQKDITEAEQNDTAKFAKTAKTAKKRLKAREVSAPVKGDPRSFAYYNQNDEEGEA
jgi:hypothetical protein